MMGGIEYDGRYDIYSKIIKENQTENASTEGEFGVLP